MAALADDVISRLPPGKFALAGFSLGGLIAFEVMARMPDRVSRLALLDTSAQPAAPFEIEMSLANIERAGKGEIAAIIGEFVGFLHAPTVLADRPELVAETTAMMMSHAAECYAPQQNALRGRPDRRAMLSSISCPTLVLCGELDLITPPAVHEEMKNLIPNARLEVIAGASHMTTTEAPDAIIAAMRDWLK
jgi:pimeloyl-ACP methyl ester carboxylesterase